MVEYLVFHLIEIGCLAATLWLIWGLKQVILETLDDLSIDLATALQGTIAEVAQNVEPLNPFQQMMIGWLQNNLGSQDSTAPAVQILKDEAGRFTSNND